MFFVAVNFLLIAKLLLLSPGISEDVDEVGSGMVVEGGVDPVAIQILNGEAIQEEDRITFNGIVKVMNVQGAPAPKAIVTLQLVAPGEVQIDQFVADDSGDATVTFEWSTPGSYRIEILDIVGDGYEYAKQYNEVRVFAGKSIVIEE